jgi:hypothetical protein
MNYLHNKGPSFKSAQGCLILYAEGELNPISHKWFRDSYFISDGFSILNHSVFPLLFNTGAANFIHTRAFFQMVKVFLPYNMGEGHMK